MTMRNITVKSSIELTPEQKKSLEKGLVRYNYVVDKYNYVVDKLIGGIIIYDGEKIVDASIASELNRFRKQSEALLSSRPGVSVTDIPKLIQENIDKLSGKKIEAGKGGRVVSAADGIVKIDGLYECKYGELILVGNGGYALAMNLETDGIGAIVLGGIESVNYGDIAYASGRILEVPVGEALFGRVVNPLGEALDGKMPVKTQKSRRIECEAPRIVDRDKVNEPLRTGILAIDSMIPIGKGQRELIIGDRQTGKTSIAEDTIINQKGKDVYCVYVAIGQRAAAVSKLVRTLEEHDALSYTSVVLATASDAATLQYIAPYTGCAIAEEMMYSGKDVLIIYDDLSKHAVAYRTISLLLKRPAGREAFPGDIFYIHSKLLERAAKLNKKLGGGSITALPIIETQAGDISAYIPTNVISITDGQIYLEGELFNAGQRPAINVGLSVSRVGGSAQTKIVKKLSAQLRLKIAHYRELAIFSQFGSSLDASTREILNNGAKMVEALKQPEYHPLSAIRETVYLFAIVNGYLKDIPLKAIRSFLEEYFRHVSGNAPGLMEKIEKTGDLDKEDTAFMDKLTKEFLELYGGKE